MLLNPYRFSATIDYGQPPVVAATLGMWLDATDNSTIQIQDNSVSSWTCKASGIQFTQPTLSNRPIIAAASPIALGAQSLDFGSGLRRFLTSPTGVSFSTPHTVFMVVRWGATSGQYRALSIYSGSGANSSPFQASQGVPYVLIFTSSTSAGLLQAAATGSTYTYTPTQGVPINTRGLAEFSIQQNNTNIQLLLNGQSLSVSRGGSNTWPVTTSYRNIGSNDSLYTTNGNIGEILIYSGTLSEAEKQSIRSYLKNKWGTP